MYAKRYDIPTKLSTENLFLFNKNFKFSKLMFHFSATVYTAHLSEDSYPDPDPAISKII